MGLRSAPNTDSTSSRGVCNAKWISNNIKESSTSDFVLTVQFMEPCTQLSTATLIIGSVIIPYA